MLLLGSQTWCPTTLLTAPLFESVRPCLERLAVQTGGWPSLDRLQALFDDAAEPPMTQSGHPIRLVPQVRSPERLSDRYEFRIYQKGELQTRLENWHDLFNALVWATFPKSKARLNARHYHALIATERGKNRGCAADALTLCDESGVIVLCADAELGRLMSSFQWKELFWRRRVEVTRSMRFLLFGHGLMEQALQPYIGLTGKGILLKVPQSAMSERPRTLDALLERRLSDEYYLISPRDLIPVPLLGIPGWWPENAGEAFYDNTAYFRPGRRATRSF